MKSIYKPTVDNNKLYIPDWCHEDTPIDYDYVEDNHYVRIINNEDRIIIDYNKYRNIRKTSYFACRWYPELIKKNIPSLYDIRSDLKDIMESNPDYKFVRLCGSSPKDVIDVPIFNNYKDAADCIFRSNRTMNIARNFDHCHLFLRKVVKLKNECRCIVHDRKVRAVSMYFWIPEDERVEIENSVITFFNNYGDKLPYNSSVLELGWVDNKVHEPFIIEFNSFGIDGFAGSSLFDWDIETDKLYFSNIPEFRYPKEYEFTC
jgi:hypothetical protein